MSAAANTVAVKVVYAGRGRYVAVSLRAEAGETVGAIIRRCGILGQCPPRFDPVCGEGAIGIFGELVAPDAVPADGDRIEICRALERDPMEARRRRAAVRA